jgi:hypothetical protein
VYRSSSESLAFVIRRRRTAQVDADDLPEGMAVDFYNQPLETGHGQQRLEG